MDDTDRHLISLLRRDARMSVAALAKKLAVSRGTVSNRLRKLEDEHVVIGYTVQLRPDAEPDQIRAWLPQQRPYQTLGTDGFGRSDTRAALRGYFGVDAASIVRAALGQVG